MIYIESFTVVEAVIDLTLFLAFPISPAGLSHYTLEVPDDHESLTSQYSAW